MAFDRNRLAFIALTLLPIIVVGIGGVFGTQHLLNGVADSVNQLETHRTQMATKAAFLTMQKQFQGLMSDNAPWDDAVENVYGTPNLEWIDETWGYSTKDENYDTSFVVDENGKTIAAYQNGARVNLTPEAYFSNTFAVLQDRIRLSNHERLEIASLIRLRRPGAIAMVTLGRIMPSDSKSPAPASRPATLVFSKIISAATLQEFTLEYGIDDLSLVSDSVATPQDVVLLALDRTPVAAARWTPRDPGLAARNANSFAAIAIVIGLLALLVPISFAHLRLHRHLHKRETESRKSARRDGLSGLPNRLQLLERLTAYAEATERPALSLLFIDLDGFKAVNDTYGHAAGDALITKFGNGLLNFTLPQDLVARLGGDEFAVVLIDENAASRSEILARQIIHFAQQPFDLGRYTANIGASIGITDWPEDVKEPMEVMRRADVAMYGAKENGRNGWRRFAIEIDETRTEDWKIATALRSYLDSSLMNTVYQPIVNSKTGAITTVETLARWPGPENYGPGRFVRVAEENGLIHRMFLVVLDRAMADISPLGNLRLAVNVSALQFNHPHFISEIIETARKNAFPLHRLELEFTETHFARDPKRTKKLIGHLQMLGVRVALDDFGTGFASLGYLRDFAFNTIKLDRSLTQGIFDGDASQRFVQGAIIIAKGLSAEIVAEGVENAEQASFMQLVGCQYLQGFFFHKAMSIAALRTALASKDPDAVNDKGGALAIR